MLVDFDSQRRRQSGPLETQIKPHPTTEKGPNLS
jgi:hypothetical protein